MNPEICESFYSDLEQQINTVKPKELLVIGGDFNAQCGSAYHDYINNMGQYGKGIVNENGYELLDLCQRNNLILTNTIFKHKLSHIITWQSPENPKATTRYGTLRRNPIRTQIDYIIVRKADLKLVTNSRSYSGINTRTDHRLVLTNIKYKVPKFYRANNKEIVVYDFDKFKLPEYRNHYKETLQNNLAVLEIENKTSQQKWDHIVKCTHETSEKVIGYRNNNKRVSVNPVIKDLSQKQRELQTKINNSKNSNECTSLRRERNQIMNQMHRTLEQEKYSQVLDDIQEVEKQKNDSGKMYAAIRILQKKKKRVPMLINSEHGVTSDELTQVKIITEFYEQQFNKISSSSILDATPQEMRIPFSPQEVKDAINNLYVLVIVWTRVQLTINSRVVGTKTSKLSESVGRGTI